MLSHIVNMTESKELEILILDQVGAKKEDVGT